MNNNITTNSTEFIRFLISQWKWAHGLILVILIEWFLLYHVFEIPAEIPTIGKYGIGIALIVVTFFLWVISTERWFHRTKYWALLWICLILGFGGFFFFFIFPKYIENTEYGTIPVRWIGTILSCILFSFAYYAIDFLFWKRKKLYIIFLISDSSKNEEKITSMLKNARYKIEQVCRDIEIIIPPFGIVNTIKGCERYINGWFCQADAVIYAKMLESDDDFGYKFTDFTSRMNCHRLPKKKDDRIDVNYILTEASKCNDWNTLNRKGNSISTKEFLAENLVQLLLIYVGCIYLYKKQFSAAIPVVNVLYERTQNNKLVHNITSEIVADAYLTAAQWEEQDTRDYDLALRTLEECKKRLPYIATVLRYKLAMARVYMLKGNIKESKKYTKSITPPTKKSVNAPYSNPRAYDWYIAINHAYYAIYERKPKEIMSNYKKLFKTPSPDLEELKFAQDYLLYELKTTNDRQFQMMLYHGLAFLYLYVDKKESMRCLEKIENFNNENGYTELYQFRDLIANNTRKLTLRKK